MRKPWMRGLKAYKFTADGCMLLEKATEHRHANTHDALKGAVGRYADAMGISYPDAMKLIKKHTAMLGQ